MRPDRIEEARSRANWAVRGTYDYREFRLCRWVETREVEPDEDGNRQYVPCRKRAAITVGVHVPYPLARALAWALNRCRRPEPEPEVEPEPSR